MEGVVRREGGSEERGEVVRKEGVVRREGGVSSNATESECRSVTLEHSEFRVGRRLAERTIIIYKFIQQLEEKDWSSNGHI